MHLNEPVGTDATLSITDSEPSPSDASVDESTKGTDRSGRRERSAKRVHFAERHEEFCYLAHLPITGESMSEDKKDNSEPWFNKMEDAYIALEDMIDDLALSCTNYVARPRKRTQPPANTKARTSIVHFV